MTFIPEITTRVTVKVDTSELDKAISLASNDEIISKIGISDELTTIKSRLDKVSKQLPRVIGEDLRFNQENIISSKHHVTGMMAQSVDLSQDGPDVLVGNTASSVDGFPYPLAIETGRREVFPVDAKVLRWFEGGLGGKPVFAKKSKKVKADPFVQPSIDDTMYDIDRFLQDFIGDLIR